MLSVNSPVACQALFELVPEYWKILDLLFFPSHRGECLIRLHFTLSLSVSVSLILSFCHKIGKKYSFLISSVIRCPSVST